MFIINTMRQRNRTSRFAVRFYLENRLKVARKFFAWALPLIYATYLGAIVNRLRRGQWTQVGMIVEIMVKDLRRCGKGPVASLLRQPIDCSFIDLKDDRDDGKGPSHE